MDTLFRLLHVKLASSPISQDELDDFKRSINQPFAKPFAKKVNAARYPYVPTLLSFDPKTAKDWTTGQLSDVYQHYINGKTDFTYYIVGDISPEKLTALASQYLANIPVKNTNVQIQPIKALLLNERLTSKESLEPRAEITLYFEQNTQLNDAETYALEMAGELLQDNLREVLREQSSGVYNVTSWFGYNYYTQQIDGRIQFTSEPSRANELINLAYQTLDKMVKQGIDERALMDKVNQHREALKQYWKNDLAILDGLDRSYLRTQSPELLKNREKQLDEINKSSIEHVLQNVAKQAARFETVLLPKNKEIQNRSAYPADRDSIPKCLQTFR